MALNGTFCLNISRDSIDPQCLSLVASQLIGMFPRITLTSGSWLVCEAIERPDISSEDEESVCTSLALPFTANKLLLDMIGESILGLNPCLRQPGTPDIEVRVSRDSRSWEFRFERFELFRLRLGLDSERPRPVLVCDGRDPLRFRPMPREPRSTELSELSLPYELREFLEFREVPPDVPKVRYVPVEDPRLLEPFLDLRGVCGVEVLDRRSAIRLRFAAREP